MTDKLVERLRELVQILVDNDPDEPVADNGCTVFDLWRPDAINALAALASPSVPEQDSWQPIETAPKDGSFLLLHVPKGLESGAVTVGAYWKADERADNGRFKKGHWDGWLGMDADIASSWCEPTHWMPLPPPQDRGASQEDGRP